jgi:signal transduction histidine kinase/CheY-like chemotaxis protein
VNSKFISSTITRLRQSSGEELATASYLVMEPLKWLMGCVLAVIATQLVLSASLAPSQQHASIMRVDIPTFVLIAVALLPAVRRRIPASKTHLYATSLYLVTVVNVLSSELIHRETTDILFLPFVLIGAGSILVSVPWYLAAVCFTLSASVPTILSVTPNTQAPVVWTTLIAGLVISGSVFASRIRSHRRILALRKRDREQAQSLKEALSTLEDQFREHREMDQRRQQLEDQLRQAQKLEAVGVLAGGVAHDMNNVLGAITSVVSLATDRVPEGDPLRQDLDDILSAARRGSTLTRNLLGFARQGTHCRERFNLGETVPSVMRLLTRTISKQVELNYDVAQELDEVLGDPGQMSHVLMNLCINSVDAIIGPGRLKVLIRNHPLTEAECQRMSLSPGRYVEISVEDTGQGIAPELLPRVFEPFFTTKSSAERSGLGLSMAYGTVKEYGGAISIESVVGRGTKVSVYLPSMLGRSQSQRPPSEHPPADTDSRRHILLVDDEPLLRSAGKRLILNMGFEVITAANGAEAVAAYRMHQDRIALVILDVAMPVMSGIDCFRRLKEVNPNICVLIASGYSKSGEVDNLLTAGACGYLGKPYDKRELYRAIGQALRLRTSSALLIPNGPMLYPTGSENH